jgi:uncharacterized protein with GYD domain
MPLFITKASYSTEGVKGLIAKPEDRGAVIAKLTEAAGGKVHACYMTTGEDDVILVAEMPDGEDAVALGMAVAATGTLSKLTTVRAWTSADFTRVQAKAAKFGGAYKPPGK